MAGRSGIPGQSTRKRYKTQTELVLLDPSEVEYRKLPTCPLPGKWSAAARRWYRDLQTIPTIQEWVEADWSDFEQTALVAFERFIRVQNDPEIDHVQGARLTTSLGAELRHQLARFAIGPAERAKHRIVLVSADQAENRRAARRKPKAVADVSVAEDAETLSKDEMLRRLGSA